MPEPKHQRLPLSSIRPDPKNPRRHTQANLASIRKCLAEFGQYRPILVNANTNLIVAGHGLYQVMSELGWAEADCVLMDLTDLQASAISITDNRTAELADWDAPKLCRQLQGDKGVESFGFEVDDLKKLMRQVESGSEPEQPKETRTIVCPKCSHHFTRKAKRGHSTNTPGPTSS